jgi:hypothetical protein
MFSNINEQTHLHGAYIYLLFILEAPGLLPNEKKKQEKANQMKKSCFERR